MIKLELYPAVTAQNGPPLRVALASSLHELQKLQPDETWIFSWETYGKYLPMSQNAGTLRTIVNSWFMDVNGCL